MLDILNVTMVHYRLLLEQDNLTSPTQCTPGYRDAICRDGVLFEAAKTRVRDPVYGEKQVLVTSLTFDDKRLI